MMRRRNVTAAVAAALCVLPSVASAADLPITARQASPVPPAMAGQINQYVGNQINLVLGNDPKAASLARDELARQPEATAVPPVNPSAEFKAAYVSAVEANLPKLLKSQQIGHRLAGAIIVTRIAKATNLSSLEDEILALMEDPSPAVTLWGVKAARSVMPGVLGLRARLGNQKLTDNVVSAVKRHPETGAIVQEAYGALDVSTVPAPVPAPGLVVATGAMLSLVEVRIGEYVKGVPSTPLADRDPTLYFGKGAIHSALPPAEKLHVVQVLCDLMSVSAERLIGEGGESRSAIMQVTQASAGALTVQMERAQGAGVTPALTAAAIAALKPVSALDRQLPAQIKPLVAAAITAVKAVPPFATLKDPPTVLPVAPPAAAAAANGP